MAPEDTTMGAIYRAALPFIVCDLIAMAMIMLYPGIALWLPSLMRLIFLNTHGDLLPSTEMKVIEARVARSEGRLLCR